MEHNRPDGHYGVKLAEIGPWQIDEERWQYKYIPCFTDECVLCGERVAKGKKPTCVKHCQSLCMQYGPVDELAAKLATATTKSVLFVPKSGTVA